MPDRLVKRLLEEAEELKLYIEVEADEDYAKVVIPGPPRQVVKVYHDETLAEVLEKHND